MGFGGTRGFGNASGGGGGGGGTAFSINAISGNSGPYELGEELVDPEFTLSYHNGPATEMSVTDPDAEEYASSDPFNEVIAEGTFARTSLGTLTFNFAAAKDAESDNGSKNIPWYPRVYWGDAAEGAAIDEALVEGLPSSVLSNTRARAITATAGAGEKIFYAVPDSFGACTFFVEGFEGGFEDVGTVDVENVHGVTITYRVYRSDQPNLGATNITVS